MSDALSRRAFLTRSGLVGCSLAASPLITPASFAAAPWEGRLVVIILRGGMDGLDVVQPYGDPEYSALRTRLRGGPEHGATDLDGYFALHPALEGLLPLWTEGQLAFVHAVSTPYRDKRSHFDGQDMLEAGTDRLGGGVRDGWLNRMLQVVPGVETDTAYAIGSGDLAVLRGAAPVANWSPDARLAMSPQAERLLDLMVAGDPAMQAALAEARLLTERTEELNDPQKGGNRKPAHVQVAEFAAARLSADARIAAFSLNGWDTHRNQTRELGRALGWLSETILALRDRMRRDTWSKTAVLALTEFGRTARENGTGGTDHGTGGLMVLAGGAIRGGRVFGDWPGLASGDLYDRRDLMPTRDVRAHAAWVMRGQFGLGRDVLERSVFPGLDLGDDPQLLL